MEPLGQPQMIGVGVGVNSLERDRLVKANILYIDGRDLRRSRVLDYAPLGRNIQEKTQESLSDEPIARSNNDSLLSRYVLEILVFLCNSDSRFYAKKFGVPTLDYRKSLQNCNVWPLCFFRGVLTEAVRPCSSKFPQFLRFCCRKRPLLGRCAHHLIQSNRLFGTW